MGRSTICRSLFAACKQAGFRATPRKVFLEKCADSEPGRIIHALLHLSLIVHPIIYHIVFLSRNLIFMRDPSSSLADQNEEA